jgi:hypothetical protein
MADKCDKIKPFYYVVFPFLLAYNKNTDMVHRPAYAAHKTQQEDSGRKNRRETPKTIYYLSILGFLSIILEYPDEHLL